MKSLKPQNPKKEKPDQKVLARSSDKSSKGAAQATVDKERLIKRIGVIPVKSQRTGNIEVRVVARGENPPKVSILRMGTQPGGTKRRSPRLGRISRIQAGKLILLLKEAVAFMKSAPVQVPS